LQWIDKRRLTEVRADDQTHLGFDEGPEVVPSPYLGVEYVAWLDTYPADAAYFESARGEKDFDVMVLGGSLAAHMAADGDQTIAKTLRLDPRLEGRKVRVHNHGRGGYKAPQSSILASLLFEMGYRPDLVILLDGFNEVALGNANRVLGANPIYPSLGHWKHLQSGPAESDATLDLLFGMRQAKDRMGGALETSVRWRLYHSAAATFLVDAIVARSRASYAQLAQRYTQTEGGAALEPSFRGPPAPAGLDRGLDAIVDIWVESSISLRGMCRVRGIPFIHVLQPTFHDEGSKPPTQEELDHSEIDPDWLEGVVHGYPRLRAAGERLQAAGVPFFDASRLFEEVQETLYYDNCHVVAAGSRMLGRYCARRALEVMEAEASDATADH
jgi:hypothetical protein